ncbi:hypothetical protein D9M68_737950 [compost metagenome]
MHGGEHGQRPRGGEQQLRVGATVVDAQQRHDLRASQRDAGFAAEESGEHQKARCDELTQAQRHHGEGDAATPCDWVTEHQAADQADEGSYQR